MSEKLKIMLVGSCPGVGITYRLALLAVAFANSGHKVHLLSYTKKEKVLGLLDLLSSSGVSVHLSPDLGRSGVRALWGNWRTRKIVKTVCPDVVYNTGPVSAYQTLCKSTHSFRPYRVATVRNMGQEWKSPIWGARLGVLLMRLARVDKIIVLCEAEADRLRKAGAKRHAYSIVFNSLECDAIDAVVRESSKPEVFKVYDLPLDRPVLGCFAHFRKVKRHDLLITAFARVAGEAQSDWLLILAGDGSEEENCKTLVQKLGINDRVRFLGRISSDEAFRLICHCNAVAHLSNAETFGASLVEPLLSGVPTLVTNVGIGHELCRDHAAVVVEKDDLEQAVTGLERVMNPDPEIIAMAKASRQYVRDNFDVNVVADRLATVFRSGIAGRDGRNG